MQQSNAPKSPKNGHSGFRAVLLQALHRGTMQQPHRAPRQQYHLSTRSFLKSYASGLWRRPRSRTIEARKGAAIFAVFFFYRRRDVFGGMDRSFGTRSLPSHGPDRYPAERPDNSKR